MPDPKSNRRMGAWFAAITSLVLLAAWGLYDLIVIATAGLSSGETISWQVYEASLRCKAIPFVATAIAGLLISHFWIAGKVANPCAPWALGGLGFGLLVGWLFLGMSGE